MKTPGVTTSNSNEKNSISPLLTALEDNKVKTAIKSSSSSSSSSSSPSAFAAGPPPSATPNTSDNMRQKSAQSWGLSHCLRNKSLAVYNNASAKKQLSVALPVSSVVLSSEDSNAYSKRNCNNLLLQKSNNQRIWRSEEKAVCTKSFKKSVWDTGNVEQRKRYTVEQLQRFRQIPNPHNNNVSSVGSGEKVFSSYEGLVLMPRKVEAKSDMGVSPDNYRENNQNNSLKKQPQAISESYESTRKNVEQTQFNQLSNKFDIGSQHPNNISNLQFRQNLNEYGYSVRKSVQDNELDLMHQKSKLAYQRSLYDEPRRHYGMESSDYVSKNDIKASDLWDDPLNGPYQKGNVEGIFSLGSIRDSENSRFGISFKAEMEDKLCSKTKSTTPQRETNYKESDTKQAFEKSEKIQKESLETHFDALSNKLSKVNEQYLGKDQSNLFFGDDFDDNEIDSSQESTFLKQIFKQPISENSHSRIFPNQKLTAKQEPSKMIPAFESLSSDQQKVFGARLLALAAQHGIDLNENYNALPLVDPAIVQVADSKSSYSGTSIEGQRQMYVHPHHDMGKTHMYPLNMRRGFEKSSFPQMPPPQAYLQYNNGSVQYNNQNLAIAALLQAFQNLEQSKTSGIPPQQQQQAPPAAQQRYNLDQQIPDRYYMKCNHYDHSRSSQQSIINALQKQMYTECSNDQQQQSGPSKYNYPLKYLYDASSYNKQQPSSHPYINTNNPSTNNALRYQNIQKLLLQLSSNNNAHNILTPEHLYRLKAQHQHQQNPSNSSPYMKHYNENPAASPQGVPYQQQRYQSNALQLLLKQLDIRLKSNNKINPSQKIINTDILLQIANLPPAQQKAAAQQLLLYYQQLSNPQASPAYQTNNSYNNTSRRLTAESSMPPPSANQINYSSMRSSQQQQQQTPCSQNTFNLYHPDNIYAKNYSNVKGWNMDPNHQQQPILHNNRFEYLKYSGNNQKAVLGKSYLEQADVKDTKSSCVFDANAGIFLPGMQYTGTTTSSGATSYSNAPKNLNNDFSYNNNNNIIKNWGPFPSSNVKDPHQTTTASDTVGDNQLKESSGENIEVKQETL